MHGRWIVTLDEIRLVATALEQLRQFLMADASQDGWTGDLVPVQMEDRDHGAIARGVEKLVGMPARRERASLRFAVANHAECEQIGIVERGAIGVQQRVTQLAAFVNRARRLGSNMA